MAIINSWVDHKSSKYKSSRYSNFYFPNTSYTFNGLASVYKPALEIIPPLQNKEVSKSIKFDLQLNDRYFSKDEILVENQEYELKLETEDGEAGEISFSIGKSKEISSFMGTYNRYGKIVELKRTNQENDLADLGLSEEKLILKTKKPGIFEFEALIGSAFKTYSVRTLDSTLFKPSSPLYQKIYDYFEAPQKWDINKGIKFRKSINRYVPDEIPPEYADGIYEFVLFNLHNEEGIKGFIDRISTSRKLLRSFLTTCNIANSINLYASFILNDWDFLKETCMLHKDTKSNFYKAQIFFQNDYDTWIKMIKRPSLRTKLNSQSKDEFLLPVLKRDDLSMDLLLCLYDSNTEVTKGLEIIKDLKNESELENSVNYRKAQIRELLLEARFMRKFDKKKEAQEAYKKLLEKLEDSDKEAVEVNQFLLNS